MEGDGKKGLTNLIKTKEEGIKSCRDGFETHLCNYYFGIELLQRGEYG
jgi:hypothetical protein